MVLFPCVVTLPDGSIWPKAKVIQLGRAVDVWVWDTEQDKAQLICEADGLLEVVRRDVWNLDTGAGVLAVVRDPTDCGCGDSLKRFRPPRPIRNGVTV